MGATVRDVLRLVFAQGWTSGYWPEHRLGRRTGGDASDGGSARGVSPSDPLTFTSVALVLTLAGFLGCAIPARRAIRVDPAITLRHE